MIIHSVEVTELLVQDDVRSIRDRLQIIADDLDLFCKGALPPRDALNLLQGDCETMAERIAELRKIICK